MTVIGLDDTDSRELGMCTTYVASRLAGEVAAAGGSVRRTLLVRLNPAVEHKTRGNAALAVHTDLPADDALALADGLLDLAADDPKTNPGVAVADCEPGAVPAAVADFSRATVRDYHDPDDARALARAHGLDTLERGTGRGVVGALAAVGASRAFEEWTYETIAYRERERWGTERDVDREAVFAAAAEAYPAVWDTVDRAEGTAVCVPRTPCPVLYGIRGETPEATRRAAQTIESEPVARTHTFLTNQGTDAHLRPARAGQVENGRAYRVDGTVVDGPETVEGGHVFLTVRDDADLRCAAFEPTKRFRDRVRALRAGDRVTVCGEASEGTLKLEKLAVRDLTTTELVTPDCPDCGRSMESAGRGQGYRCRDCGTAADGKVERPVERELEEGWYEVPPVARRHIAKPLVRGGFDAPTHPER
ncbi:MAG: tRNA(Ile)(2)-agmatinylcytidine synthase [Haloarculaceae archaeon]